MILVLERENLYQGAFKHKLANITVEDHFRQCFDDYFDKLYGYAFTIVKNNAEAKDIVQTAFIKLWEKRNEVNPSSAKPYLFTTVYHLSLNTIRNLKIRESHHENLNQTVSVDKPNRAEEKETGEKIRTAIDSLPPRCKEVFCKSRFEGKKYAEIAKEMDISVKTVEVQMGKALKQLREQLSDLVMFLIAILLF